MLTRPIRRYCLNIAGEKAYKIWFFRHIHVEMMVLSLKVGISSRFMRNVAICVLQVYSIFWGWRKMLLIYCFKGFHKICQGRLNGTSLYLRFSVCTSLYKGAMVPVRSCRPSVCGQLEV